MSVGAFFLALALRYRFEPPRIAVDGAPVACSSLALCEKCGIAMSRGAAYQLAVWGGDPAAEYIWVLPDGSKQEGRTASWTASRPGCLTLWTRSGAAAAAFVALRTWGGR